MGGRKTGRPLSKGQLREWRRMNKSRGSTSKFLGEKSEERAELICLVLREEGKIKNIWRIPSHSSLDYQGIDIICETARGFFFLDVKKSAIGVTDFVRKRDDMVFFRIYPWKVGLELTIEWAAKKRLENILNTAVPSCAHLSEEIKQKLNNQVSAK